MYRFQASLGGRCRCSSPQLSLSVTGQKGTAQCLLLVPPAPLARGRCSPPASGVAAAAASGLCGGSSGEDAQHAGRQPQHPVLGPSPHGCLLAAVFAGLSGVLQVRVKTGNRTNCYVDGCQGMDVCAPSGNAMLVAEAPLPPPAAGSSWRGQSASPLPLPPPGVIFWGRLYLGSSSRKYSMLRWGRGWQGEGGRAAAGAVGAGAACREQAASERLLLQRLPEGLQGSEGRAAVEGVGILLRRAVVLAVGNHGCLAIHHHTLLCRPFAVALLLRHPPLAPGGLPMSPDHALRLTVRRNAQNGAGGRPSWGGGTAQRRHCMAASTCVCARSAHFELLCRFTPTV